MNYRKEAIDFAWDATATGVLASVTMPMFVRSVSPPPTQVFSRQTVFFGAYIVAVSAIGGYAADMIRAQL